MRRTAIIKTSLALSACLCAAPLVSAQQIVEVTLTDGTTILVEVPAGVDVDQATLDAIESALPDPAVVTAQDAAIAAADQAFVTGTLTAEAIVALQALEVVPIGDAIVADQAKISSIFDFDNCILTVNGRSVDVNSDGSFSLPNVSAADQFGAAGPGSAPDFLSDDFVRVVVICQREDMTVYGFSEPFQFRQGESFVIESLTITTDPPPLPTSIRFGQSTGFLAVGDALQVGVTGELPDGTLADVTARTAWTVYRTSNPSVATISQDGLVTGVAPGVVFLTAVNEGATAVRRMDVTAEFIATTVEGFVQTLDGDPVAGADVVLSTGQAATSGADGLFSLQVQIGIEVSALSATASVTVDGASLVGASVAMAPVDDGITDLGIVAVDTFEVGLGLVVDDGTRGVLLFDPETDTPVSALPLPTSGTLGDCSILLDGSLAFVTDFQNRVWVIDLTTRPISLAAGTNPIAISNPGEDTSITPDQRYLVVCDGSAAAPLVVVDIAQRVQITSMSLGSDCNSVQVFDDGSIVGSSWNLSRIRRLSIDSAGNLTDTGDVLSVASPINVIAAPGATSGVAIQFFAGSVISFTVPGLVPVTTRNLSSGSPVSGLITASGDRLFVRGGAAVDVFDYDAATGVIGPSPVFSIPVQAATTYFGMDQMALHPNGQKLYVPQAGILNVYDANTGVLLTTIDDPILSAPTGICIVGGR